MSALTDMPVYDLIGFIRSLFHLLGHSGSMSALTPWAAEENHTPYNHAELTSELKGAQHPFVRGNSAPSTV